jgi:SAM-dependent methyltransferase
MSKTMTNFAHAALVDARPEKPARAVTLPPEERLFELPPGEARDSLFAVHGVLGKYLPPTNLAIYEAGGGSTSPLPLDVLRRAYVTAVDIDPEQIRNNLYAHETILGDVQTYRFAPGTFDLVICYNVIEHLPDVEAALLRFCESLKPGGLVLIGAPNPRSLSGVVTKYTPHWFHVWFYRYVIGDKEAGQPGHAPYPTFFHPLVTPSKLEAFAKARGFRVIYKKEYESPRFPEMRTRQPLLGALLDTVATVMNLLLLGRADVRAGDYHVVLQKP